MKIGVVLLLLSLSSLVVSFARFCGVVDACNFGEQSSVNNALANPTTQKKDGDQQRIIITNKQ
jgi:hypothetical protein